MWKTVNSNFGQLSLILTDYATPQMDIEPRYPGPEYTLEPFGSSSVTWYVTAIPENLPRNATNTLTLSSLGRN
jgi:hypothetical protein